MRLKPQHTLVDTLPAQAHNRGGHPAPEVLKRFDGDAVFRTDLNGAVSVSTDGRRLWSETGR